MFKKTLLLTAALVSSFGAVAQALPDGTTSLLPAEMENPRHLLRQYYKGIRPAVGYPSLPDQSEIFDIDSIMPLSSIGISLTENGAMSPAASTCGLIIAHPESRYFTLGPIGDDQADDYQRRRAKARENNSTI